MADAMLSRAAALVVVLAVDHGEVRESRGALRLHLRAAVPPAPANGHRPPVPQGKGGWRATRQHRRAGASRMDGPPAAGSRGRVPLCLALSSYYNSSVASTSCTRRRVLFEPNEYFREGQTLCPPAPPPPAPLPARLFGASAVRQRWRHALPGLAVRDGAQVEPELAVERAVATPANAAAR